MAGLLTTAVVLAAIGMMAWIPRHAPAVEGPQLREFTLTAEQFNWDLQPGVTVTAWGYNGQMPGPEIRVREGDHVRITLINHLPVATTIHWHGVNVPPEMDGPAGLNQAPVEPGQTFVYDFIATPAGTRWYHSHTDTVTQVELGLYGAFIVDPKTPTDHYDREYTYILAEWDAELTPDVATGKAPRGPRDSTLRGGELGADYFLMNGHMDEAINPVNVRTGDHVLIRLINAGSMAHPIHMHGHSFKIVATDGNPVPPAAQLTKDTVLVAPGERYDIVFDANNPGVWMLHCHIESHAANGMMTLIQYEGYAPTGPLRDLWALTPGAIGSPGAYPEASPGAGMDMTGMSGMDGMHGSPDATPATGPPPETATAPANPGTPAASQGSGKNATIIMLDDRFVPKAITITAGPSPLRYTSWLTAGTTVTWVNNGADWHSVSAFDGSFDSGQITPGQSFSYTFTTPSKYSYICKHHGRQGMIGMITVTR